MKNNNNFFAGKIETFISSIALLVNTGYKNDGTYICKLGWAISNNSTPNERERDL